MNASIFSVEYTSIFVLVGIFVLILVGSIYAYLKKGSKLVMQNQPIDLEQLKKYKKVYDQKTNTYVLRAEILKNTETTNDNTLIG